MLACDSIFHHLSSVSNLLEYLFRLFIELISRKRRYRIFSLELFERFCAIRQQIFKIILYRIIGTISVISDGHQVYVYRNFVTVAVSSSYQVTR